MLGRTVTTIAMWFSVPAAIHVSDTAWAGFGFLACLLGTIVVWEYAGKGD